PISDKGAAAAAAAGQTSSDTATQIFKLTPTCEGKAAATFTYDLGRVPRPITGPPSTGFGLSFAGDAVLDKKKGVWLISSATVCDRSQPTSMDDRAARIADSSDPGLRSIIQGWVQDNRGGNASATVNHIRCTRSNRATVDYDLILAGNPLPGVVPVGRAVRQE